MGFNSGFKGLNGFSVRRLEGNYWPMGVNRYSTQENPSFNLK